MNTSDQQRSILLGQLEARAIALLHECDLGGWTKAAPSLYPHQWSWDSAFIAIGLAHLDTRRAAQELRSLFAAQWATGKVPHIVFNPAVRNYFPDAARWASNLSPAAPTAVQTSGLCQPPVHAIAAHRIGEVARASGGAVAADGHAFLLDFYPRLFAWHRYLATDRDPEQSGLITIYHPWESGTDNAPRWDRALAAAEVGEDLPPYERADLKHVSDPAMRPTAAEYDRYLWFVELLKRVRYDEQAIYATHPFLVKDVFMSAIFVAANTKLLAIAEMVGAPDGERAQIGNWRERGLRGIARQYDDAFGLALDYDVRAGASVRVQTMSGFAPLIAGGLSAERRAALLATWDSSAWLGDARLRWAVPPSTSPDDPAFDAARYWRGPSWPVMNWLFWWALREMGETARAARLRDVSLDQLLSGGLAEYFHPFTGEPLGSLAQSWTASSALDWLRTAG